MLEKRRGISGSGATRSGSQRDTVRSGQFACARSSHLYASELKYTFEALQKIIMELDGSRLSRKVQVLKTLLCR